MRGCSITLPAELGFHLDLIVALSHVLQLLDENVVALAENANLHMYIARDRRQGLCQGTKAHN